MAARIETGSLAGLIGQVIAHADGQALIRVHTPEGLVQAWVPDGEYRV